MTNYSGVRACTPLLLRPLGGRSGTVTASTCELLPSRNGLLAALLNHLISPCWPLTCDSSRSPLVRYCRSKRRRSSRYIFR
jgi:hypothetical protein